MQSQSHGLSTSSWDQGVLRLRTEEREQNNGNMPPSLLILVTGDPVPTVHSERGGFPALIRSTVGDVWTGDWVVKDARTEMASTLSHDWSGVIITGSPASLTERAPWMDSALIYAKRLVDSGTPTLGICFGHQLMGEALGGRVERNPAGREIGTVLLQVNEKSPLLPAPESHEPPPVAVNMTHLDSVVRLPVGAKVLARTSQEAHAFVQFGPEAWGVQFHPEMDTEVLRRYIEHREEDLVGEGLDVSRLLEEARETPHSHELLQRFAQYVHHRQHGRSGPISNHGF